MLPNTLINNDIKLKTEPKLPEKIEPPKEVNNIDTKKQTEPVQVKEITEIKPVAKPSTSTAKQTETLQVEEPFDYDNKTLKAKSNDWICKICTLINPNTINICAVCASVKPAIQQTKIINVIKPTASKAIKLNDDAHYKQLLNLDNADLVENLEKFECLICMMDVEPGEGVTLRECLHIFCKLCLAHTVEYNEEAEVKCPYRDNDYSCNIALQDREIKALVTPLVYEQYLARSIRQAENKIDKSFHCKTPDCEGWCIFEDNVNDFRCPVCKKINCLTCQVS